MEKDIIAKPKFLNFIRGICVSFPLALSAFSKLYIIRPQTNPIMIDAINSNGGSRSRTCHTRAWGHTHARSSTAPSHTASRVA